MPSVSRGLVAVLLLCACGEELVELAPRRRAANAWRAGRQPDGVVEAQAPSVVQRLVASEPLMLVERAPQRPVDAAADHHVDLDLPVRTLCSTDSVRAFGVGVRTATGLSTLLLTEAGDQVCDLTSPDVLHRLLDERRLSVSDARQRCPRLTAGDYRLVIFADDGSTALDRSLLYVPQSDDAVNRRPETSGATTPGLRVRATLRPDGGFALTPVLGPNQSAWVLFDAMPAGISSDTNDVGDCDRAESPLIIHLAHARGPRAVPLRPPSRGVRFDLLGRRAWPAPHTLVRVGWLAADAASSYAFLALPDADGAVRGIDQLFGNNTFGPTGFALDGWGALAQWDGRRADGSVDPAARDGRITDADDVFARLRLWRDLDGDGVATPAELSPLAAWGLRALSLDADPRYEREDAWGNRVTLYARADVADGSERAMFDLWLAY